MQALIFCGGFGTRINKDLKKYGSKIKNINETLDYILSRKK